MAAEREKAKTTPRPEGAEGQVPSVRWDDSQMATTYANVVNAASTREELTLFFGTNQTWNVSDGREFTVQLTNRIILNPHAAKRLARLLASVLNEYESRYGPLEAGPGGPARVS